MKHFLIVALICINAALVVGLVFGAANERAYGQVLGANYLIITGEIGDDYEAVWILSLADRRLAGLKMDRTKKRMVGIGPQRGRDLTRDFGRRP